MSISKTLNYHLIYDIIGKEQKVHCIKKKFVVECP